MDERVTRLWAATEAKAIGCGGIATVVQTTASPRVTGSLSRWTRRVKAGPAQSAPASMGAVAPPTPAMLNEVKVTVGAVVVASV
jgi:hypothetical protein